MARSYVRFSYVALYICPGLTGAVSLPIRNFQLSPIVLRIEAEVINFGFEMVGSL